MSFTIRSISFKFDLEFKVGIEYLPNAFLTTLRWIPRSLEGSIHHKIALSYIGYIISRYLFCLNGVLVKEKEGLSAKIGMTIKATESPDSPFIFSITIR